MKRAWIVVLLLAGCKPEACPAGYTGTGWTWKGIVMDPCVPKVEKDVVREDSTVHQIILKKGTLLCTDDGRAIWMPRSDDTCYAEDKVSAVTLVLECSDDDKVWTSSTSTNCGKHQYVRIRRRQ